MHVCVPLSSSAPGLAGEACSSLVIAEHFGLAEVFAVVDTASGEIVSTRATSARCPGPCACPLPDLENDADEAQPAVEALAGPAAGFRLLQRARRAGLPILASRSRTLGELQRELKAKSLPPLSAAQCLSGARARRAGGG